MVCHKCNRDLDYNMFSKRKSSKTGFNTTCKECRSSYHREIWYPKNKARRQELNENWRAKIKQNYDEFKKDLKCTICGETESCCLDFHHLIPGNKEYSIAILARRSSIGKLMKEIEKCVIVCSNCHRKIHKGLISI